MRNYIFLKTTFFIFVLFVFQTGFAQISGGEMDKKDKKDKQERPQRVNTFNKDSLSGTLPRLWFYAICISLF